MTPLEILIEANRHGLQVSRFGDHLSVTPVQRCPAGFLAAVREHKPTLLRILALPSDQRPWLHICRQVLSGEFDQADSSTAASITIGLQSLARAGIAEADCAIDRLNPPRQKKAVR